MIPHIIDLTVDLVQIVYYSFCIIKVMYNSQLRESLLNVSDHNEIWNLSVQMLLSRQYENKSLLD